MKKNIILLITLLIAVQFIGCLVVETKEYTFKIKKDNSGSGSIKFINIMSDIKDTTGSIQEDYNLLIDSYLKGEKLLEDLPNVKNVKKRLFEEDNQLCGEITFDFDDITKMKFYKYKDIGPWCYCLAPSFSFTGSSEAFFSSNGTYGGEYMPVIFWDGDVRKFEFKTTLTAQTETTKSLLHLWKKDTNK